MRPTEQLRLAVTEWVSAVSTSGSARWIGDKCSRRETAQCVAGRHTRGLEALPKGERTVVRAGSSGLDQVNILLFTSVGGDFSEWDVSNVI